MDRQPAGLCGGAQPVGARHKCRVTGSTWPLGTWAYTFSCAACGIRGWFPDWAQAVQWAIGHYQERGAAK